MIEIGRLLLAPPPRHGDRNAPFRSTLWNFRARLDAALGKAWIRLGASPELPHLYRYQAMLNRMHHRAFANLLMLRDMFPDDAELQTNPIPFPDTPPRPASPPAPSTGLPPSEPVDTSAGLPSPKPPPPPPLLSLAVHVSVPSSQQPQTFTNVHALAIRACPPCCATYNPSRSRPEPTVTLSV